MPSPDVQGREPYHMRAGIGIAIPYPMLECLCGRASLLRLPRYLPLGGRGLCSRRFLCRCPDVPALGAKEMDIGDGGCTTLPSGASIVQLADGILWRRESS